MKQIAEDIKNKSFHSAYLLYGEESFLKNQYRLKLQEALVPEGDSMNFSRMEGKGQSESEIVDLAETLPFFAERRVILLENTGFFKNKADILADYLARLPDYLVLIFVEEDVDKRSRMFKALKKAGIVSEFASQKEDMLSKWVVGLLAKENKKIKRNELEFFLSRTGTDMGMIHTEVEKLLSYTMGRDVITREDIEAISSPLLENRIFAMIRAVSEKKQKQALAYYYDLLALKEPPMRILFLLAREFRLIRLVKVLRQEGLDQKSIAAKVGIAPFAVKNYVPLAGKYTEKTLLQAAEDCADMEERVKTGRLSDVLSVELLITKYTQ